MPSFRLLAMLLAALALGSPARGSCLPVLRALAERGELFSHTKHRWYLWLTGTIFWGGGICGPNCIVNVVNIVDRKLRPSTKTIHPLLEAWDLVRREIPFGDVRDGIDQQRTHAMLVRALERRGLKLDTEVTPQWEQTEKALLPFTEGDIGLLGVIYFHRGIDGNPDFQRPVARGHALIILEYRPETRKLLVSDPNDPGNPVELTVITTVDSGGHLLLADPRSPETPAQAIGIIRIKLPR